MSSILVIGGSLGGLMAANMLLRAGHDVRVLEKTKGSLDGRGAGIVAHRPLFAALARCGVDPGAALGVTVRERVVLGTGGQVEEATEISEVLTSWSRLYSLLLAAFPKERYLQGIEVKKLSQAALQVTVVCEDGRHFESDMVLAADGIRSSVRAQLAPAVAVSYAGYVAWRGVCDEAVLSQNTLDTVFEKFGFGLPLGEQLIGYPVAGAGNSLNVGSRRYNYVWYRPVAEGAALKALLIDEEGAYHANGLPPHKVPRLHVADVKSVARAVLAPQFAEIVEKTERPFLQAIYDCASEKLAFGRVALMGDAAFVARPHVGMGVTKAAQDASALTDWIAKLGATPASLLAFESQRLPAGRSVVARARELGAGLQAGSSLQAFNSRNAFEVMTQTAIDLSPEFA